MATILDSTGIERLLIPESSVRQGWPRTSVALRIKESPLHGGHAASGQDGWSVKDQRAQHSPLPLL